MQLSIDTDFPAGLDFDRFFRELHAAGLVFDGIHRRGDVLILPDPIDKAAVLAAAAAHSGQPLTPARLAGIARAWDGDASRVRWDHLAHVTVRPVASVVFALDATIERIDWIDPSTAAQVDPYGERYTGDVVVSEERTEVDGPLGPQSRSYSFTAYRTDGDVYQTWQTPVEACPPAIQAKRGQARRDRAIQRVSGWLAAALGGTPQLQAWMALKADALAVFRDLAEPGPMIQAVTLDASPAMSVPISTLGIHLVTDLDPAATLKDALLAVLARWS